MCLCRFSIFLLDIFYASFSLPRKEPVNFQGLSSKTIRKNWCIVYAISSKLKAWVLVNRCDHVNIWWEEYATVTGAWPYINLRPLQYLDLLLSLFLLLLFKLVLVFVLVLLWLVSLLLLLVLLFKSNQVEVVRKRKKGGGQFVEFVGLGLRPNALQKNQDSCESNFGWLEFGSKRDTR